MIIMQEVATAKYTVRGSKFYAHLYSIGSREEIDLIFKRMQGSYEKACHVCYGAVIDNEYMFKNDGEVGQPGRKLLSVLTHHGHESHVLVVARVSGRVKLGPAGVGRAFKEVGLQCL